MLTPLPKSKWNYATAAHLLNRAGFGGTPPQIEKLAALGLDQAVSHLVDYEKVPDDTSDPEWAKPDPERFERFKKYRGASPEERRAMQREEQRTQRERILELRHWWLQRMVDGPRPLQEKLTLFWHGHFATSAQKVREAYFVWRQNDIFRRHASGKWLEMLDDVSKDPAMLIWLDQAQSRKQHPNENFARELMELFTLGEGHYTEKDITEAARALTGWSLDRVRGEFADRPALHDSGDKTIFGKTGNFNGDDVLKMVVEHPQSAKFITAKLWTFFASENPPVEVVNALARQFRESGYHFKPVLRTMFSSETFYSDAVVRNQVKSPVQWLVGSVKLLERPLPPPLLANNALRLLGQDLFMPPNVKGWDGGLSWITTNNLLTRYNFATFLVLGENPMMAGMRPGGGNDENKNRPRRPGLAGRMGTPIDPAKLLSEEERKDKKALVAALEKRLLQGTLREKQAKTLQEYLEAQAELDQTDILHAFRLVMSTPEYQLA